MEAMPSAAMQHSASSAGASCDHLASLPCVFIVALGRTGSTHLLRLLNAIDGYRLSGETDNAWIYLGWWHAAQQDVRASAASLRHRAGRLLRQKRHFAPAAAAPTTAELSQSMNATGSVICALRELLLLLHNPAPRARVFGFKEIYSPFVRDPSANAEVLAHGVGFMRALFPRARFVFHTRRNLTRAADSDFWRRDWPDATPPSHAERYARIAGVAARYNAYAQAHPGHAFATTLEGLTDRTNLGEVEALFRFLGEPLTPRLREVARERLPLVDWVEEKRPRLVTRRGIDGTVRSQEWRRFYTDSGRWEKPRRKAMPMGGRGRGRRRSAADGAR